MRTRTSHTGNKSILVYPCSVCINTRVVGPDADISFVCVCGTLINTKKKINNLVIIAGATPMGREHPRTKHARTVSSARTMRFWDL